MEDYTLIRSRRKTIGLSMDADGRVIVRAPYLCTRGTIDRFVREQAGWIARQREKLAAIDKSAAADGALSEAEIRALSKSMKAVLPEKLARYSAALGVTYGRVSVRCQKSKWGSCSSAGNLNFSCLLMLAPDGVLEYVIVHELCHRRHMDHSKRFWADVELVFPAFRQHKKWLRENGPTLLKRAEEGRKNAG